MENKSYHVLGVMSGTSLDGVDIAQVKFTNGPQWSYQLGQALTLPYPQHIKKLLEKAVHLDQAELDALDETITHWFSDAINTFIARHKITDLDAVCSHGHTVKHEPQNGFTLQIGNRPELAHLTGHRVVCDFRVQDVALGGQGAPLVPIGDKLLFGSYDYCLNLGGFANVSTDREGRRIAYDICPVNTVLNYLAEKMGLPYDKDGKIATQGVVDQQLLEILNNQEFYQRPAPKTLGIEWVHQVIFPLIEDRKDIPVVMRTFATHVAMQLARHLKDSSDSKVLVTGGGAFNQFLMQELRSRTSAQIIIPSRELVEYKEAIVFALLGVLRMRGEVNTLSSVTGAREDHSAGKVFEPMEGSVSK